MARFLCCVRTSRLDDQLMGYSSNYWAHCVNSLLARNCHWSGWIGALGSSFRIKCLLASPYIWAANRAIL
uniref:Uncharacterized protein n=1 Tax=Picea glauca TaxID=3330 RepID=A0A101M1V4_PICGL|nr:hypothetical protein ABT39_MTgene2741 [Picea glauca]QHR90520.1 hypothetical protein Q903MT_gene4545 [Picea sitchensis]